MIEGESAVPHIDRGGALLGGFHSLPVLDLGPAGIVLGLLVVVSLSIVVLVPGMLSSLRLAPQEPA